MQIHTLAQSLARVPKLGYCIEEAAVISGISRSTLYRELIAKRLPSFRDGRRRLIARTDLEAMIDRMKGTE
ncbi:MAG TPA: helix-turn-helix domain-containing protein [Steroidobacteraceae bacterium]|nr:helix-turn-helix domain-containing protein [Steroidobacteraceae bacterium]